MMLIIGGVIALVLIGVLAYFLMGSAGGSKSIPSTYSFEWRPNRYPYQNYASQGNTNTSFDLVTANPLEGKIENTNPDSYRLPAGSYNFNFTATNDSNDTINITLVDESDNLIATITNSIKPWSSGGPYTGSFTLPKETKIKVKFSNNSYQYNSHLKGTINRI